MIDRYTLSTDKEILEKHFNASFLNEFIPRYNAGPTQDLPVITLDNTAHFQYFKWGLISNWANNKKMSPKLFNLDTETLSKKASHQKSLKSHRCLIPVDGFYVWKPFAKKKSIPYFVSRTDKKPLAIAGIWEEKDDFNEKANHTFIMITQNSDEMMTPYQENMPLCLGENEIACWMNADTLAPEIQEIIKDTHSWPLTAHPVSPLIANLEKDMPSLIEHSQPSDQHGNYTLFQ